MNDIPMPRERFTYDQVKEMLPTNAVLQSTYGRKGEAGYIEYYRVPGGSLYRINNGPQTNKQDTLWLDPVWTIETFR